MEGQQYQPVLRCLRCNKPFDKQSSLKRHGYYCRSRKEPVSRSRSCYSCAQAKVRCDVKHPVCSRCVSKDLKCRYPSKSKAQHGNAISRDRPNISEQKSNIPNHSTDLVTGDSFNLSDPPFGDPILDEFDWSSIDLGIADILGPDMNNGISTSPFWSPQLHSSKTLRQHLCSPAYTIPRSPTENARSLTNRPRLETRVQRTASLIIYTLKSYPRMMVNHSSLPPFIHQRLLRSATGEFDMEPLVNCVNLVHMITSGYQGSRKLFWKNVRSECEQMLQQCLTYSKWKLLAAMQAITIYILIRLDEGETEYNNSDSLLVSTVTLIAQHLNSITAIEHDAVTSPESNVEISWEQWIWEESMTRICVIYRIVNMLVYFEPAMMCDLRNDLVIAPLPARKQLWEASDSLTWQIEAQKKPNMESAFGLATNGELVKLHGLQLHGDSAMLSFTNPENGISTNTSGNWEEWCSGMDSFGGLVMLAASFVV